jgi:hypothetical protein
MSAMARVVEMVVRCEGTGLVLNHLIEFVEVNIPFMIWTYDDYLKIKDASGKLYETYCCICDNQQYLDY